MEKRYRRQDEIGTPFCITVDYQTLEDGTVTLRERDSMAQRRVHQNQLLQRAINRHQRRRLKSFPSLVSYFLWETKKLLFYPDSASFGFRIDPSEKLETLVEFLESVSNRA